LPSNINDDIPIIDLAKAKNGYILSNDHFKDHIQSGFLPTKFRAERLFKCYALKNELVLIEPDQYKVPMLHSLTQLRVSKHNGQPKQVIQDTKSEESVYNKETTSTDNSTDRYLQCNSCKNSIPRGKYLGDESKFQCYECRPKLKCTMCKILTPKGKYEGEPSNFACYKCRTGGPNEKTSVIIPKANITTVSNHENIDSLPIAAKVTRITTASNHKNIDSLPIAAEVKSQEDNKEAESERALRLKVFRESEYLADASSQFETTMKQREQNFTDQVEVATCCLCFDDQPKHLGIMCSSNHFTCNDCLERYVSHQLPQQVDRPDFNELRRQGRPDGNMFCPLRTTGDCYANHYNDSEMCKHIRSNTFENYLIVKMKIAEQRVYERQNAKWAREIQRIQEEMDRKGVEIDRQLLTEQLQRQFPNAYQCGKCGHGPIDKRACDDLSAHHGQRNYNGQGGTINNACPSCGWFSPHIRDWPKWNGKLPESVDASTKSSLRSGGSGGSSSGTGTGTGTSSKTFRYYGSSSSQVRVPPEQLLTVHSRRNRSVQAPAAFNLKELLRAEPPKIWPGPGVHSRRNRAVQAPAAFDLSRRNRAAASNVPSRFSRRNQQNRGRRSRKNVDLSFWSCRACTLSNKPHLDACELCETLRY
jgi:hypothetical protein